MNIKERVRELAKNYGISIPILENALGFSSGSISKWDKSAPGSDKLEKVAEYFQVSTDYLLGRTSWVECPICFGHYNPLYQPDIDNHNKHHDSFVEATKKFGTILSYAEAERNRSNCITHYHKHGISLEERISAYEDYLKYDYMSFLWRESFDPNLEDFETYCKKDIGLATTKEALDEIDPDFYPALVKKGGIIDDEEYHKPRKPKLTSRDERDIKKDLEILREKLENKEFGPAAFDGEDISEDDTDLFLGQLELMLRRLKVKNKEKYNPHKNKSR